MTAPHPPHPYAPIAPPRWPEGRRTVGEQLARAWVQRWTAYRNKDPRSASGEEDPNIGRALFAALVWNTPYPTLKDQQACPSDRLRSFWSAVIRVTPNAPAWPSRAADEDDLFALMAGLVNDTPPLPPLPGDGPGNGPGARRAPWWRMRFHPDDRAAVAFWAAATPGVLRSWTSGTGGAGNAMDDLVLFWGWSVFGERNRDTMVGGDVSTGVFATDGSVVRRVWGDAVVDNALRQRAQNGQDGVRALSALVPPEVRLFLACLPRAHRDEIPYLLPADQAWSAWCALVRGVAARDANAPTEPAPQDLLGARFRVHTMLAADRIVPVVRPTWAHGTDAVPDVFARTTDRLVEAGASSLRRSGTATDGDLAGIAHALMAARDARILGAAPTGGAGVLPSPRGRRL